MGAGPERNGDPAANRFWQGVARRFLLNIQQAAADFWLARELEGQAEAAGVLPCPGRPGTCWPNLSPPRRPIAGGEYLEDVLPAVWSSPRRRLEAARPGSRGPIETALSSPGH